MIQKIQAFEIPGKGTATESKIEVQSRFTTGDKAVIYYDLRDPNGTTPALDLSTQNYVTLPYAILSRSKVVVTGADRAAVIADSREATNILKRERTDISVISGIKLSMNNNSGEVCIMYSKDDTKTFYLDTEDLSTASVISETEDMQNILQEAGYVSDGKYIRYWVGNSFDEGFLKLCKG